MNDSAKIEELSQEVQRLRRSMMWISIILVILVFLYVITGLPVLLIFLTNNPLYQLIVVLTIGFIVSLFALREDYLHWGHGESG